MRRDNRHHRYRNLADSSSPSSRRDHNRVRLQYDITTHEHREKLVVLQNREQWRSQFRNGDYEELERELGGIDFDSCKEKYTTRKAEKKDEAEELPRVARELSNHNGSAHIQQLTSTPKTYPYDYNNFLSLGYINTSWVWELHGKKLWLATQTPQEHMLNRFFSLFRNPVDAPSQHMSHLIDNTRATRLATIVQLDGESAEGSHPYLPGLKETKVFKDGYGCHSPISVEVTERWFERSANCVKRTLALKYEDRDPVRKNERITITHFQFLGWICGTKPHEYGDAMSLLNLANFVKKELSSENELQTMSGVVHCSTGTENTGTFIACSSLARSVGEDEIPTYNSPLGSLDQEASDKVTREVDCLREQRPAMITDDNLVVFLCKLASRVEELSYSSLRTPSTSSCSSDSLRYVAEDLDSGGPSDYRDTANSESNYSSSTESDYSADLESNDSTDDDSDEETLVDE